MTPSEFFHRVWEMLVTQGRGPMHFRVLMQPLVSVFFAFRFGISDAREGRPALLLRAIFIDPVRRPLLLREAWQHVGRLFLAALTLDFIYQLIVYRWIYPTQALITAFVLAFVPYVLLRGVVTRIASRIIRPGKSRHAVSHCEDRL